MVNSARYGCGSGQDFACAAVIGHPKDWYLCSPRRAGRARASGGIFIIAGPAFYKKILYRKYFEIIKQNAGTAIYLIAIPH
jgi:hypothetical protein